MDFVVTNFGRNTPYRASAAEPAVLYYGDVDGSGLRPIIETRWDQGASYPRREFSAIAAQLPTIGATYPTLESYGEVTIDELFGPERLAEAMRLEATTLDSGVLVNEGQLKFRFEPLPDLAQLAPALDAEVADVNHDGRLDVVLAQNLLGTNREVGPLNGGMGLVLLGQGGGRLEPMRPDRSGVVVPQQARHVKAIDLDGNGGVDLVFGAQGGIEIFLNSTGAAGVSPTP